MDALVKSSSYTHNDPEKEFYETLSDEFDKEFVTKLKSKQHQRKKINWFLLHKYAKHFGYFVSSSRSHHTDSSAAATSSSSTSHGGRNTNLASLTKNKFTNVVKKYAAEHYDDNDSREKAIKGANRLMKVYDESGIHSIEFQHEYDDDNANVDEDMEDGSNSSSGGGDDDEMKNQRLKDRINYYLKKIESAKGKGNRNEGGMFEHIKVIREAMNKSTESEIVSSSELHHILFYGRNGNGKSTLLNMLLFSTMISPKSYEEGNQNDGIGSLEVIQHVMSSMDQEQATAAFKLDIIEEVKKKLGIDESDFDESGDSHTSDNKHPFDIVGISELTTQDLKWGNEQEYQEEMEYLRKMTSGEDKLMLGDVKPFILKNPGRGNQTSCTAHITFVRYGHRWQAAIYFYKLDEILGRFDATSGDSDDRQELWNSLCSLSLDNESHSKRLNIECPKSRAEAESAVPQNTRDFLKHKRGFIIVTTGRDVAIDRMGIRSQMFKILKNYHYIVKDITLFAPSTLLYEYPISLVDAPGDDDADWIKSTQLKRACDLADSVIMVCKRDIKAGINLQNFAVQFVNKLAQPKNQMSLFVYLREENDDKSQLEQLLKIKQEDKEKEKKKSKDFITKELLRQARKSGKTDEEKVVFEDRLKNIKIDGGYFFYFWCAMRAFGDTKKNQEEKIGLLKESGYDDIVQFIGSKVPKLQRSIPTEWINDVVNEIKHMKAKLAAVDGPKPIKFIRDQIKGENSSALYYHLKECLKEHLYFSDPSNIDNAKEFSPINEILKLCDQIAKNLANSIDQDLRGEGKDEFIRQVESSWEEENIQEMLSEDLPDTIIEGEYRIYPDLVMRRIDMGKLSPILRIFNEKIQPEYIEVGKKAIEISIFKTYVDSGPWNQKMSTRSSQESHLYKDKINVGLKEDIELKNAHEFVISFLNSPETKNAFETGIKNALKRLPAKLGKEKNLLHFVNLDIKRYLFKELRKSIKDEVNGEEIRKQVIQIFKDAKFIEIIRGAVIGYLARMVDELFYALAGRSRLPILKEMRKKLINSQLPSLSDDKKIIIVNSLDAISRLVSL